MADWEEQKQSKPAYRPQVRFSGARRRERPMTLPQLLRYFQQRAALFGSANLFVDDPQQDTAHYVAEAYTDAANCLEASIQAMLKS